MTRRTVVLPSMSRVTAGAIATLELPIGLTYNKLIFTATGTALAAAHIKRINVLIDGKVIQTFKDLTRLIDINSYYGRGTDTVNEFVIHFFRAELMDIVYRRAPGIGTQDVQTFHVEIELDAAAPVDINMLAHADVDPQPQPIGAFFKVREFPYSSAVSGQVEIDKLPRGAFYGAVHLFKDDITAVEVEVDQAKTIDATKSVLERLQKEASPSKRVPVTAKATHIDWLLEGDAAQAIKTDVVQDFRIKMMLGTSGAVDIVTETIDTIATA